MNYLRTDEKFPLAKYKYVPKAEQEKARQFHGERIAAREKANGPWEDDRV